MLIIASLEGGLGEAALRGLLFGVAFYLFSIPWIYTVMHQYGPLPSWEAAGVMALDDSGGLALFRCLHLFR